MFLVRDLVSPRTWLAMTSHLAGFVLGLAFFVVIVTGLSLGALGKLRVLIHEAAEILTGA